MLTSDLIGPTWSIKYQANAKSTSCKFIENQNHQDSSQRNQAQKIIFQDI
jgi:hypothetical protein